VPNCERGTPSKIPALDRRTDLKFARDRIPLKPFYGGMGVARAGGPLHRNNPGRRAGATWTKGGAGRGQHAHSSISRPARWPDGTATPRGVTARWTRRRSRRLFEAASADRSQGEMPLNFPRAETATDYISMAFDPDLTKATTMAIQEMVISSP
jgi:hypothetical protein